MPEATEVPPIHLPSWKESSGGALLPLFCRKVLNGVVSPSHGTVGVGGGAVLKSL